MELVSKIENTLWEMFDRAKYQNVRIYIEKFQELENHGFDSYYNFNILFINGTQNIDLTETLHKMSNDLIIRIATDLGIDTPDFFPVVYQFKNLLKENNQNAYQNFERAIKSVREEPDLAVSLASSTLEGIIKTILNHHSVNGQLGTVKNDSLTKLMSAIVKRFDFDNQTKCPPELITIASQLRGLGASIDQLRSDKSASHGKDSHEYVVNDPLWAAFIVNVSATLGLFLWNYFELKFKPKVEVDANPWGGNLARADDDPWNASPE